MVTVTGSTCIFELVYPSAHEIYVVGDFNRWSDAAIRLHRDERGVWRAEMELPPGTYRFGYMVDGQWLNDYAAFGLERDARGQWNSVLLVPEPPSTAQEVHGGKDTVRHASDSRGHTRHAGVS